jgi:hypothetical protein
MSKRLRVQYDEGSDEERLKKKKKKEKEKQLRTKRVRREGEILIVKIDKQPIAKEVLDSIYKNTYHEIYSHPDHYIGTVQYETKEEICIYHQIEHDITILTTDDVLESGKIRLGGVDYRLMHLLIWTYRCHGKEVPLYVKFRNNNPKDLSSSNICFTVCHRKPKTVEYESYTIVNKISGETFTAESLLEIGRFIHELTKPISLE